MSLVFISISVLACLLCFKFSLKDLTFSTMINCTFFVDSQVFICRYDCSLNLLQFDLKYSVDLS